MRTRGSDVTSLGPLERFVAGLCMAGVLTLLSGVLFSRSADLGEVCRATAIPAAIAGIMVGVLSAFGKRILEFLGQLFAQLFP
jgi:hypothetical protein